MTTWRSIKRIVAAAFLLAAPAAVLRSAPLIPGPSALIPGPSPLIPGPDPEPPVTPAPSSVTLSASEGSPAWPEARGPFSWADRVMNSTTISRGAGSLWQLRSRTAALYTPSLSLPAPSALAAPDLLIPGPDPEPPVTLSPAEGSPALLSLDPSFFRWLLSERMHEDAAALLFSPGLFAPSDTLQYLRGLLAYEVHDFQAAEACFSQVPAGSPYAPRAQLFLDTWRSEPEIGLPSRSPFLAAAMSAVIPGAGKIYAGDLNSGLSTLLIVGALGAMTAEAWSKLGLQDWRTIGLASVFGVFYIGNIYGSALSVSVIRNTYADAQKATLLFGIRLPLHGE